MIRAALPVQDGLAGAFGQPVCAVVTAGWATSNTVTVNISC